MRTKATATPGENSPLWHLRVHTFGPFQIEWLHLESGQLTPLPPERLRGQNAATALGLFKALLSRPDRFATRSWLLEQFWPDSKHRAAEERLNDVVSSLRGLLRPPGCTAMLVHFVYGISGRGAGFRLDPYPHLWCDADAFAWYVTHGMLLDQRGQDSTACWEHAYALAERGMYLPEQIEEDWSRARRDYLQGLLRDCVQRWTHLLRQAGCVGEAIMRLRSYWLEHPTDEDALRLLIDMLGDGERFAEAEECYAKARAMLEEEGHAPDDRTTEAIEAVRALKVRRKRMTTYPRDAVRSPLSLSLEGSLTSFPQRAQGVREQFDLSARERLGNDMKLAELTSDQLAVLQVVLGEKGMAYFDPSKRETLQQIAFVIGAVATGAQTLIDPEPWERLSVTQMKASALNTSALESFERLIGEGWKLSNTNQLEAAEGIIASFLPKILALPSGDINERIAFIASQGLRLQSVLIHHRLQIADKVRICQKSVEYARQANDTNTLVTALIELADAYEFDGQIEKCMHTLQEALFYSPQTSSLIRSRAYSNNAIILAGSGRLREAELYIGLAHDAFPDDPTLDPGYALADSSIFTLSYHTGLVCLDTNQVSSAPEGFELYQQHSVGTDIPERLRLEIVNGLSKAAIMAGDQERYVFLLEKALVGASALGSKKRFDEAIHVFHQVPQSWQASRHIKNIAEKYHLKK